MNVRTTLAVLGGVAGVAGLALAFVPGLADDVTVARAFVFALGMLAAVLAVADVRTLAGNEVDQAEPDDVEVGVEHPRAGAAVDDLLAAAARGYDRSTQDRRDEVEERVREAAFDVLARREDATRAEVETMLAEGSWTDDPYAAAFLGAIEVDDLPLRERIVNALRPEARFARRATAAIDAIAEREGVVPDRAVDGGDGPAAAPGDRVTHRDDPRPGTDDAVNDAAEGSGAATPEVADD